MEALLMSLTQKCLALAMNLPTRRHSELNIILDLYITILIAYYIYIIHWAQKKKKEKVA